MSKPKLKLVDGEGQPNEVETLTEVLNTLPRYAAGFKVVEDRYFKHLYNVLPMEDRWIVVVPEDIDIFWSQVAAKVLAFADPEIIWPYTTFNPD